MAKIREKIAATTVLISSPSSINRSRMGKLIAALEGHEVVALAADLSETFNHAEILCPDVVVIAAEFTSLDEFSAMRALFDALGSRWIVLHAGAGSPDGLHPAMDPRIVEQHLKNLRLSGIQHGRNLRSTAPSATAATTFDKLVVIGSSTGGVDALITILSTFPAECPPTAIVQHTGRGFSDSLVQLLERRCKPQVVAAQDGLILRHGMVCLAGGIDGHLSLNPDAQLRCQVRPGPPVSGHVPSIDTLFRSAVPLGASVVAALLTGMGQDGAAGLLELRQAGATTFGQDEATSVVYGMPKAAWERGAVQVQLPVQRIGPELLRAASKGAAPLHGERRAVVR